MLAKSSLGLVKWLWSECLSWALLTGNDLPCVPGQIFLAFFFKSENSGNTNKILFPLENIPASSKRKRRLFTVLSWTFFGFILAIFAVDIVDACVEQFKVYRHETRYGFAGPIIALIYVLSFCNTQLSLFMAGCAVLFLIRKRDQISKSSEILELLVLTLKPETSSTLRVKLRWLRWQFWAVLLFTAFGFLTMASEGERWLEFQKPMPYACMVFPRGLLRLYFPR